MAAAPKETLAIHEQNEAPNINNKPDDPDEIVREERIPSGRDESIMNEATVATEAEGSEEEEGVEFPQITLRPVDDLLDVVEGRGSKTVIADNTMSIALINNNDQSLSSISLPSSDQNQIKEPETQSAEPSGKEEVGHSPDQDHEPQGTELSGKEEVGHSPEQDHEPQGTELSSQEEGGRNPSRPGQKKAKEKMTPNWKLVFSTLHHGHEDEVIEREIVSLDDAQGPPSPSYLPLRDFENNQNFFPILNFLDAENNPDIFAILSLLDNGGPFTSLNPTEAENSPVSSQCTDTDQSPAVIPRPPDNGPADVDTNPPTAVVACPQTPTQQQSLETEVETETRSSTKKRKRSDDQLKSRKRKSSPDCQCEGCLRLPCGTCKACRRIKRLDINTPVGGERCKERICLARLVPDKVKLRRCSVRVARLVTTQDSATQERDEEDEDDGLEIIEEIEILNC